MRDMAIIAITLDDIEEDSWNRKRRCWVYNILKVTRASNNSPCFLPRLLAVRVKLLKPSMANKKSFKQAVCIHSAGRPDKRGVDYPEVRLR